MRFFDDCLFLRNAGQENKAEIGKAENRNSRTPTAGATSFQLRLAAAGQVRLCATLKEGCGLRILGLTWLQMVGTFFPGASAEPPKPA